MASMLHLYGGWPGHAPYDVAEWTAKQAATLGLDVDATTDIFRLDRDLTDYDLIVLGWNNALTTEDLSDSQERHLLDAVAAGTGLVAWHGAGAAFRSSLSYSMLLGGSFLAHPAGEGVRHPFTVTVTDAEHPVSRGLDDFEVASEQYYMQVDPSNHVLAETVFDGEHLPWLDGVRMPVAWVRTWGRGRVFYSSIGHYVEELDIPQVSTMVRRALEWAVRTQR